MAEVTIKKIPAHVIYTAEFDVKSFMDFFDFETGSNQLYDLQYEMKDDNPEVIVPEIGDDYNYFEYPIIKNSDGTMHVVYCDMVDRMGKDSKVGDYSFVHVEEVTAACCLQKGPFDSFEEGFEFLLKWIRENGYETDGRGRLSAINGPWDRDSEEEYLNECQMIIR